jgi:hypothetical protein
LEEGSAPPLGTIYLLSPVELEALRKFLDENITTRLLHSSSSPHGAHVLFVKKRMVPYAFAWTSMASTR